jgi:hypothetical protein
MCSAMAHVRYGPKADIAALFDHLIGAGEKRWRHRKAERLLPGSASREFFYEQIQEFGLHKLQRPP